MYVLYVYSLTFARSVSTFRAHVLTSRASSVYTPLVQMSFICSCCYVFAPAVSARSCSNNNKCLNPCLVNSSYKYIYIYIYICASLSLSLSLHIYIYIHIYNDICICVYIYIYVHIYLSTQLYMYTYRASSGVYAQPSQPGTT